MSQLSTSRFRALRLIPAVVIGLAVVLLPALPASAVTITQGISGHVTNTANVALPGIEVAFIQDMGGGGWNYIGSAATDASGNYSRQLLTGSYRVAFDDRTNGDYVTEFYDGTTSFDAATTLAVTDSKVITAVDAQLAAAGHITGHTPGTSGWVDAYTESSPGAGDWQPDFGSDVGPDGNYDIGSLPAGNYRLEFHVDDFVPEFWENSADVTSATSIAVTGSHTVSGIDPVLTPNGHITGHVQDDHGNPLQGVEVDGYVQDGTDWVPADSYAFTDVNGDYDFSAPAGTYRLEFFSYDGFVGEYYDDSATLAGATGITVASAQTVGGKDAVLATGARLSGAVTLPAAADPNSLDGYVSVIDTTTGDVAGDTWLDTPTTAGGHTYDWSVGGLPAGHYRVEFGHEDGPATVEAEFYDDHPESAGATAADAVTLTAAQQLANINATLRTGGTISGTLVDGAGAPLAGCDVVAFRADGSVSRRLGTTGADGAFVVTGLTTQDYGLVVGDVYGAGNPCPTPEYFTQANGNLTTSYQGLRAVSAAPGSDHPVGVPLVYDPAPAVTAAKPTVSPTTPTVGSVVTASPGTWTPADTALAYQWSADGTPISGATSNTYTPVSGDIGKTLTVTVTGTRTGYTSASSTSDPTAAVVAAPAITPGTPTISYAGSAPQVATQVTASPGTWNPSGLTFSYQWKADGNPIAGATSATYVPLPATAGKQLTVTVTGSKAGLVSQSATSDPTPAVLAQTTVANLTAPSVSGIPRLGFTLSADDGVWYPFAATTTRQWLRNGVPIAGATSTTYTPGPSDVGAVFSVSVTASSGQLNPRTVTSAATPPLSAGILTVTDVPRLVGILKVGKVLTALPPSSSPVATQVRFQWLRGGKPIPGLAAKRARYKLVKADRGHRISVQITQQAPGYTAVASVAKRLSKVR